MHPGYSVANGSVGTRGASITALEFSAAGSLPVLCRGAKGSCLVSANANAFERLVGCDKARVFERGLVKYKNPLKSIRKAQFLVHSISKRFNLRKVNYRTFPMDRFRCLAKQERRTCLVSWRAKYMADHVILIDGETSEVIHNEEQKRTNMSSDALRTCWGGDAKTSIWS